MSMATVADLPTSSPDQLLVNARTALVDLSRGLRHLEPEDLGDLVSDLEDLKQFLSTLCDQARSISQVYDSQGQVRSGCIVMKPVNNCGPYGYLVTSAGGRRHWKYLGKADQGIASGVYAPGTPMRFKTRRGWTHTGESKTSGGERSA